MITLTKIKNQASVLTNKKTYPILIAVFIFLLKLVIINSPEPELPPSECIETRNGFPSGCGFVFDEAHYVPIVRKYLMGKPGNNEHPPLSKFTIAAGMMIFGDNPLGWRVFPSLFFSISVAVLAYIAYELTGNRLVFLIAPILYGFDVMAFNIGQLAMLDSPAIAFALLGTCFFIRERYIVSSLFLALAMLGKTAMLFTIMSLLVYKFLSEMIKEKGSFVRAFSKFSPIFEKMIFIIFIIFLAGLAVYDYGYNAFPSPFNHLDYMVNYHSQLKYNCSEFNLPFNCVVREEKGGNVVETVVDLPLSWTVPFFSFTPAPYHIVTLSVGDEKWNPIAYWGIYSPTWWTTWVVVTTLAIQFIEGIRRGRDTRIELFILCWILFNYGIYFILAYVLQRWVYPFYFITTLPALAIGIVHILYEKGIPRAVLFALLAAQLIWFFIFFPVKSEEHIMILKMLGLPR